MHIPTPVYWTAHCASFYAANFFLSRTICAFKNVKYMQQRRNVRQYDNVPLIFWWPNCSYSMLLNGWHRQCKIQNAKEASCHTSQYSVLQQDKLFFLNIGRNSFYGTGRPSASSYLIPCPAKLVTFEFLFQLDYVLGSIFLTILLFHSAVENMKF